MYSALHLRSGAREWFMAWLAREHPELVDRYESMYRGSSYAPKAYRSWLAAKIRPIIARHGLQRGTMNPTTRMGRSAVGGVPAGSLIAEELPPSFEQPTLF
jgi:hypothetical protein